MSVQLLITSTEAREKLTYTLTDPDLIKDEHIRRAQWNYIRPALGQDFYDEILSEKAATFSTANQTLYDDYIKPAMQYFALAMAAPSMQFQGSNTGFVDLTNNRSEGLTVSKSDFLNTGNSILSEMKEHIDDNASSFTLYAPLNDSRNGRTIFY